MRESWASRGAPSGRHDWSVNFAVNWALLGTCQGLREHAPASSYTPTFGECPEGASKGQQFRKVSAVGLPTSSPAPHMMAVGAGGGRAGRGNRDAPPGKEAPWTLEGRRFQVRGTVQLAAEAGTSPPPGWVTFRGRNLPNLGRSLSSALHRGSAGRKKIANYQFNFSV